VRNNSIYFLPNTLGGKTGFTYQSGRSLVASYPIAGREIIAVVIKSDDERPNAAAAEVYKLFDWLSNALTIEKYDNMPYPQKVGTPLTNY